MDKIKKEIEKYIFLIPIVIILVIAYTFFISPFLKFKEAEHKLREAGMDYYEVNNTLLPVGNSVSDVSMQKLREKGMLEEDLYIPFTRSSCSPTESWVKVKYDKNGKLKYYTYLSCGIFKSNVDNEGPQIILNDKDELTVSKGEKFKDPGIKKVVDKYDGNLSVKDVIISGDVDTSKIGKYEINYRTVDKLKNVTIKKRVVHVVQMLNTTVKSKMEKEINPDMPLDNYIKFAGNLYQIIGMDENNNIKIYATNSIGQVNKTSIDKYLEKYYETIPEESKKLIIETKVCVDKYNLDNKEIKCQKYKNKKITVPSVEEIMKITNKKLPLNIFYRAWTANNTNELEGITVSAISYQSKFGLNKSPMNQILEIMPLFTIKGDTKIKAGVGTKEKPYDIGATPYAKAGTSLAKRYPGEYVVYSNKLWRISNVSKGQVKLISDFVLMEDGYYRTKVKFDDKLDGKSYKYNPKQSSNLAYKINNSASSQIKSDLFDVVEEEFKHYKNDIAYEKEAETTKYKVKFYAPSIFDFYSSINHFEYRNYWFNDTSEINLKRVFINDFGQIQTEYIPGQEFGERIMGTLKKNVNIEIGEGTKENPFKISK